MNLKRNKDIIVLVDPTQVNLNDIKENFEYVARISRPEIGKVEPIRIIKLT